ncbi:MAG: S-methyl-5-thioribose-1-phosphate isomerase [Gammaproteobacteria bacterium]
MTDGSEDIRALRWAPGCLHVLDQRELPVRETWLQLGSAEAVAAAIRDMAVRGAPAIGIAAAYGVVLSALRHARLPDSGRIEAIDADIEILAKSRPTAVNLFWALRRMHDCAHRTAGDPAALLAEAEAILTEDLNQNRRMAEQGAALIEPGSTVLTHCNTGSLATGGHGTALGVIRSAWHAQRLKRIFATETRPWLQGARLTVWELARDSIPVTLITDSAAATTLRDESIRWVIVGADRIAANGDVTNKVGTYSLAVLARQHGARLMVVAPSGTVDLSLVRGADVPIEYREPGEIWRTASSLPPPAGVTVRNPAFDVTPATLVDVLVTERGIIEKPDADSMAKAFASRR